MLSVEMEDVLAVLGLIKPYLYGMLAVAVIGIAVIVLARKAKKAARYVIRCEAVILIIAAVIGGVSLICYGPMSTLLGLATGSGTVDEEINAKAGKVAEAIMEEGIVLLENEGVLPLEGVDRLNVFGWESINPAYGGAGSGGINDLYPVVSLLQGLEDAGFEVNQELVDFYSAYSSSSPEMSIQKQSWTLPEPPAALYSKELMDNAKEFSDTALIVISRKAGEGHNDIPIDVSKAAFTGNSKDYDDFAPGEHYLQLSHTERDLVELVTSAFDRVIVVYNGANQFELGFVEEYESIKGAIWCPGTGNRGFSALGKILRGTVNPSGRTPDTFMYDMEASPWFNNAEQEAYTNLSYLAVEGMNAGVPQVYAPAFTNYVEGIYVGYKFYETAAAEGLIDYETAVQYPFGYGLSYTTFEQRMGDLRYDDGRISFDVTVTNTGSRAGKDVVEVYFKPPYTDGGIEKSVSNLIAFEKTSLLQPGKSEKITISFALEDMASYDYKGERCYVLEEGDYVISINRDSHNALSSKTYTVRDTVVYSNGNKRESDKVAAENLFDYALGNVTVLSRAGHFANYEEAVKAPEDFILPEPYLSGYHLNSNFDFTTYLDDSDTMPPSGVKSSLMLKDLVGAGYDDPRWMELVQKMSVTELQELIAMAGYQTAAVPAVGKVGTLDFDGPAAINNNFTGAGSIGFPIEVAIASTWSKDLAREWGRCMGELSRTMGAHGWYAPGMNIHRTPFGARNYEYFSEDGVLSGHMGAEAVKGAEEYGVYAYIKHFVLYEGNGKMISVWADEQTIREIYLKPFEISVKEGGAKAVMVSWSFLANRWTGETSALLEGVLRSEWGFRGMALTDFFRNNGHGFMNADAALANGVDAMLSTYNGPQNNVADPGHPTSVIQMQRAAKNILYTVSGCWAYESEDVEVGMEGWKTALIIIDAAVAALLLLAEYLIVYRGWKKRKEK